MKKSNIKIILFTILLFMPKVVLAADYAYRGKELKVVYIIGVVLMIIRIATPILLIVLASIDLIKALTTDEDENGKSDLIEWLFYK